MKEIKNVVKVYRTEVLNNSVIVGVNSKAKDGEFISRGDKIVIYKRGETVKELAQNFRDFISYYDGILYLEENGSPIYYTDFIDTKQFTPTKHYFNSLQLRIDNNRILISTSDDNFQHTFYLFSQNIYRKELPKHATFLLDKNFVNLYMGVIEFYDIDNMKMQWSYRPEGEDEILGKKNIFIDENRLYVPLNRGSLAALDLFTGKEIWRWRGQARFGTYGLKGDYIYVHGGNYLEVVSKYNGKSERILNYGDYLELQGFYSSGIIWCFDKILIVKNSGTGEIVIFDRISFEVLEREIVDNTGIGESKDRIQLVDGYLYIWSTGNTLHIYNLNETLPDLFKLDH